MGRTRVLTQARRAIGSISGVAAALWATSVLAGPSLDQFEIKELGTEAGTIELESQNDFSSGNPRRRIVPDGAGGFVADDNTITRQREGLEIEMGLTSFLKLRLGVEFEQGRIDDPTTFNDATRMGPLEFDGYGAETIWTVIPRKGDGFGAGFLVEYDQSAHSEEASTLTIGPIFEWQSGRWSGTFNPTAIQYFGGGEENKNKVDFGYAARIMYRSSEQLSVAIESYGGVERITGGTLSESELIFGQFNQYRAGPIAYWTFGSDDDDETSSAKIEVAENKKVETTVGMGMLFGLNDVTPATTLKFSIDVDY